jgi:hypothetical protein
MPVRQVPTVAQDFRLWLRNAALTANVATSTLTDDRVGFDSCIALVPTTANAAAEIGNGTLYIAETGRINGSVVINHANNAQTDRTFRFIISG